MIGDERGKGRDPRELVPRMSGYSKTKDQLSRIYGSRRDQRQGSWINLGMLVRKLHVASPCGRIYV